tara:strand:- start:2289 stop:2480 length:192 start_codon:yes stop_codon:yes gene_type:complete
MTGIIVLEDDLFGGIDLDLIKKEISESVLKESRVYEMNITKHIKNGKTDKTVLTKIEEVKGLQ